MTLAKSHIKHCKSEVNSSLREFYLLCVWMHLVKRALPIASACNSWPMASGGSCDSCRSSSDSQPAPGLPNQGSNFPLFLHHPHYDSDAQSLSSLLSRRIRIELLCLSGKHPLPQHLLSHIVQTSPTQKNALVLFSKVIFTINSKSHLNHLLRVIPATILSLFNYKTTFYLVMGYSH